MGLGPLADLVVGFAVMILIAGKKNLPRNPIVLAQQCDYLVADCLVARH
jgi:hypothetical protein